MTASPACPTSEYDPRFWTLMTQAMGVSFHKYGAVRDGFPHKVDAIRSLKLRLDRYLETGNSEYLVDVANFAMIEFMLPRHPNAHFKSEESSESPGRYWNNGSPTAKPNTR